MIKCVLIDDEPLALSELRTLLKKYDNIEVIGTFTNPLEFIARMNEINPQIVFIDISMPEMSGLDAASIIISSCPQTCVVFATAFNYYAVEAFELHALDYIVKPVSEERLDRTISKILEKYLPIDDNKEKELKISCLGKFKISWENSEAIKWRSEKTKELFAYLLQNRNRELSKNEIIDSIWPDMEIENATHQFSNAMYYIRKTFIDYGIDKDHLIINQQCRIELGNAVYDVELFENSLFKASAQPSKKNLEEAKAIYTSEYLKGCDWNWAIVERERLENRYWQIVRSLSRIYMDEKQFEEAENLLINAYKNNPLEDETTEALLELYICMGAKVKAEIHYRNYKKILAKELGIRPNAKILRLNGELKKI